jgi:hypothetical protein
MTKPPDPGGHDAAEGHGRVTAALGGPYPRLVNLSGGAVLNEGTAVPVITSEPPGSGASGPRMPVMDTTGIKQAMHRSATGAARGCALIPLAAPRRCWELEAG